ncbi:hypothetical protein VTJ49DRAFT_4194 [Mycothermus thermophilus]|uniref:Uncharacterized protein n=1 Tax=Humicola insolens TaxID=85995 RepID=A0ABR3V5Y3_HUMIN
MAGELTLRRTGSGQNDNDDTPRAVSSPGGGAPLWGWSSDEESVAETDDDNGIKAIKEGTVASSCNNEGEGTSTSGSLVHVGGSDLAESTVVVDGTSGLPSDFKLLPGPSPKAATKRKTKPVLTNPALQEIAKVWDNLADSTNKQNKQNGIWSEDFPTIKLAFPMAAPPPGFFPPNIVPTSAPFSIPIVPAAASIPPLIPLKIPIDIDASFLPNLFPVDNKDNDKDNDKMNPNSVKEENLHPAQKTHRDQSVKLQGRLWGLRQGLYAQPGVPKEFLTAFDYDVQELMNNTVRMNQAIDIMAEEIKKSAFSYEQRITARNDKIRELEYELQQWQNRHENSERTVASMLNRSEEDMRTIQFLKEQLRQSEVARAILQEQVNGKRNLWMNVHTDPKERAAAMESLARSSPNLTAMTQASSSPEKGPNSVQSVNPPSTIDRALANLNAARLSLNPALGTFQSPFRGIPQSHSGPAIYQVPARRNSNGTMVITQSASFADLRNPSSSRRSTGSRRTQRPTTIAETGSPIPIERRRVLPTSIVRENLQGEDLEWAETFQTIFALIYGYCVHFFSDAPVLRSDWKTYIISEGSQRLWNRICAICHHHGDRNYGDSAQRICGDNEMRPYLVQRLIVEHILTSVCKTEGWKGFSEEADAEFAEIDKALAEVDSSKPHERQALIDRRTNLVKQILASDEIEGFTTFKKNECRRDLMGIISPFIGKNSKKSDNAYDNVPLIISDARDLSTKMMASGMTFEYEWPQVGLRYYATSYEPVNSELGRVRLQEEHWRIKMCATPAITVRDDSGYAIKTTNLLQPGVLVYRPVF